MSALTKILGTLREWEIAPKIVCSDGFTMSVQASRGHYCTDALGNRPSFGGDEEIVLPFSRVEVGYPSERPEPWQCTEWSEGYDSHSDHIECDGWSVYSEDPDGSSVYAYVPTRLVKALIALHGGEMPR